MKCVGIYIKRAKKEAGDAARMVIANLERHGLVPMIAEEEAHMYDLPYATPTAEVFARCDLLIVLGGDGTFLAAARLLRGRQVPVLGVNLGGMGFMTEIRLAELPDVLELAISGEPRIIGRMRLDVTVHSGRETYRYTVLNDVVITKSALARIFDLKISVGGNFMYVAKADGLIISTPTGSTAYNLAAGGPIVHPQTNGLIITPICPHMLTNRPIVVPGDRGVDIELVEDTEVYVTCDGQEGREIHQGDSIEVVACDKPLLLIKNPKRTYFDVLREKLHYGER